MFFADDGRELFRLPGFGVSTTQPPIVVDRAGHRYVIGGGASTLAATDLDPPLPSDYAPGQRCAPLDRRAGATLLTCWQPRVGAAPDVVPPTLEISSPSGAATVVAGTPAGERGGHWTEGYLSPDRRWVAATWRGECEATTSWLINTSKGSQASAVWAGFTSGALGWTSDSRAIFALAAEPGCGRAGERPGIYALRPGEAPVQLIAQQSNDSASVFWGPEQ